MSVGQQAGRGRVQGEKVLCTMLKRTSEPKPPLRTQPLFERGTSVYLLETAPSFYATGWDVCLVALRRKKIILRAFSLLFLGA